MIHFTLLLSLALSIAAFGSFSWALGGHFRTSGRPPTGMILLSAASLLSFATYIVLLCSRHPATTLLATQSLLVAISLAVFWWAISATRASRFSVAHSLVVPNFLFQGGPYRYVRHPFYLSYIIFWVATAVAAGSWQWSWVTILSVWYVSVARQEESAFASSPHSFAYADYRARTGMILPRLGGHVPKKVY